MNAAILAITILLNVGATTEPPPIRIAYFVPGDRQPIDGHVERIDRIMTEVQRFYREGMEAAGYGPKTFRLDRDPQGLLRIELVRGRNPLGVYGRNAARAVRDEVEAALARQGLDVNRETLLIFQVLLDWEGDRATEIGPFVGGGDHLAGTAWVYDDARLDPRLFSSKAPGGYYHGPCSLGAFNTHYIGGVAHELGHAFGLPHDCQREGERAKRGSSLMGGGNHTYGRELRGEGPGAFLSVGSAMLLAHSRPFAGDTPDARDRLKCEISNLDAQFDNGKLVLTGNLVAEPPAFGIVAFNDWKKIADDYDAVSWTCNVDDQGRFRLEIGELRPGPSQLRLKVCHANGGTTVYSFDYEVDSLGEPKIEVFQYSLPLEQAVAAYAAGNREKALALANDLRARFSSVAEVNRKACHLLTLLKAESPQALATLPVNDGWVSLSAAKARSVSSGWGPALRDQAPVANPGQCFLQVGGKLFEQGLFAHAPSKCEWELDGKWASFRSGYGLQDGHEGSVVFVVRCDGREALRSPLIKDQTLRTLELDVRGVGMLELSVEDGGDGKRSDWSVWAAPQLQAVSR